MQFLWLFPWFMEIIQEYPRHPQNIPKHAFCIQTILVGLALTTPLPYAVQLEGPHFGSNLLWIRLQLL